MQESVKCRWMEDPGERERTSGDVPMSLLRPGRGVAQAWGPRLPCALLSHGHLRTSTAQLPRLQSRINEAPFLHFKCVLLDVVLPLNDPGNVSST